MSKELTQVVAGKRIAWLMAILAAVMIFATVAQQAQKAHAIVPAAASLTIVAPDVQVLSSGFITVTAKDVNGVLVANGTVVTATVTCGALSLAFLGGTTGPVQTAVTVSGVATFGYLAPSAPCLVNMVASSGLLLTTATFNVAVPLPTTSPAVASLTIVAPDVQVLGTSMITVTAKDINGAFVANGTSVTLNVTCGNLLDPILGTTFGPVGTTGTTSGVASFFYLAPSAPCLVNMVASSGLLLTTATFNVAASLPTTSPAAVSLTIVAPDVQVLSSGFITVTAKDVNGAFVANGTSVTLNVTCGNLLDPILGTTSGPVQTTGTVSGVATFGYLAPATPCLVTMSASSGLLLKTATFNVGPVPAVAPTDPGVILSGGLLCFNYSGPTTTLANFAAFFAAGVDGINIQQPNGSYKSWFRSLPSAATATVLVNGDRVCAGGTAGSNVFA